VGKRNDRRNEGGVNILLLTARKNTKPTNEIDQVRLSHSQRKKQEQGRRACGRKYNVEKEVERGHQTVKLWGDPNRESEKIA